MGLLFLCTLLAYDASGRASQAAAPPDLIFIPGHFGSGNQLGRRFFSPWQRGALPTVPWFAYSWLPPCGGSFFFGGSGHLRCHGHSTEGPGTLTLVREPNLFQKLPGVLPGTGSEQEFLKPTASQRGRLG